jgi:uncharacterized surface protein with fasciclin (FAS1) repeats
MKRILSFSLLLLITLSLRAAGVLYVSAAGDNSDGLTWATAFHSIKAALAVAQEGDQLWVAHGEYAISQSADQLSFVNGVDVFGGFAGSETLVAERNPVANPTIIKHDDTSPGNFRLLNSADLALTTIWDGFVFDGNNLGLGVRLSGNTVLSNSVVKNCVVTDGSGAAVLMSATVGTLPVKLLGSEITGNKLKVSSANTTPLGGAAIFATAATRNTLIEDCRITANTIEAISASGNFDAKGAGLMIYSGVVRKTTFDGNKVINPITTTYTNNIFTGGAIAIVPQNTSLQAHNVLIEDCVIKNSESPSRGGAIIIDPRYSGQYHGEYTISRSIVSNNKGRQGGALAFAVASSQENALFTLNIENSVFANNSSVGDGGGAIFMFTKAHMNVTHSTFVNNVSGSFGGGSIFLFDRNNTSWNHHIDPVFRNVIFWGNSAPGRAASEQQVRNSNQHSHFINVAFRDLNAVTANTEFSAATFTSTINLDAANDGVAGPHFVNPSATAGWNAGGLQPADWSLGENSVCIDAGGEFAGFDINGIERPQGDASDMGAYEYVFPVIYLTDIINNSPDHTILAAAIETAGLDEELMMDGAFTVFAPTDAAFNALAPEVLQALLDDEQELKKLLLLHVAGKVYKSEDFVNDEYLKSLEGRSLRMEIANTAGKEISVNNAKVTAKDLLAQNGVLHVVDAIIEKEAMVLIVSQAGDGTTGSTWETAYTTIQDALAVAVKGDEVLVAAGVYEISSAENQLKIISGVNVTGSFNPDAEPPVKIDYPYASVIKHAADSPGNFRLVTGGDNDEMTTWNSFVIDGNNLGLGVRIGGNTHFTNSLVQNCVVTNGSGAGILASVSAVNSEMPVWITNTTITGNKLKVSSAITAPAGGAGIFAGSHTRNLLVDDCLIEGNTIEGISASGNLDAKGAGIMLYSGKIHSSILNNNKVVNVENAAYTNNVFTGGAIAIVPQATTVAAHEVLIENCTITNSVSPSRGGAIIIDPRYSGQYHGKYTIKESIISNNMGRQGGAIFFGVGTAQDDDRFELNIENSVLSNNQSSDAGGAIYMFTRSKLNITNSTIVNNHSGAFGGGGIFLFDRTNSTWNHIVDPVLKNVILWGNVAPGRHVTEQQIRNTHQHTQFIHTAVQGLASVQAGGEFTSAVFTSSIELNADNAAANGPKFENPSVAKGYSANGNPEAYWNLDRKSVCVDAGGEFTDVDIEGATRPNGKASDIGAYEFAHKPLPIAVIIAESPDHKLLNEVLVALEYDEVLSEHGTYTVFAPVDAAFDIIPQDLWSVLLTNPEDILLNTLLKHVANEVLYLNELEDGFEIETISGEILKVKFDENGKVFINNAMIIHEVIEASNGIIYSIDAIIGFELPEVTVFDIIAESPEHTILHAAIVAAELVEALSGDGPFTVFAPTNAAFEALPEGVLAALLADPQGTLAGLLLNHVVDELLESDDLTNGQIILTLLEKELKVSINQAGDIFINNAKIIIADIVADNGIVHVIDAVLLDEPEVITVMDIIKASEVHTILATALAAAELDDILTGEGPFTVFAPTNAAFDALPEGTLAALLADATGALKDLLLNHVVDALLLSADLTDGKVLKSLADENLKITINGSGDIFVNNVLISIKNVEADNGVVHVINAVLIPVDDTNVNELMVPEVKLYPNPVSDRLYIAISHERISDVSVFNVAGVKIPISTELVNQQILDVSGLPAGFYFIRIETGNHTVIKPFIKN